MSNERKILYVSAGINFIIGIIAGIVLFCGQMRNGVSVTDMYEFDVDVSVTDFVRMAWINLIWMISVVAARSMLQVKLIHPVLIVRGCVNSFSLLYIFNYFGIKESLAAILPQCFSVLPMLMMFSSEIAVKGDGVAALNFRKSTVAVLLLFSAVSSGIEVMLFKAFCIYLF